MTFDTLPVGVVVVKTYRSGMSQLSCAHHESHQYPTGGYVAWRSVSEAIDLDSKDDLPDGWMLDYKGTMRCRVCGGDEDTTDCFARPVRMLGFVPRNEPTGQDRLFA